MPLPASHGARVLLASTPGADAILRHILEPLGEIVSAFTHEEAMERIEAGVDLVVCSLRFDESRTLDLIAEMAQRLPHLPFICCRVQESDLPESSLRAAFTAAGHLGVVAVVDLPQLVRAVGEDRAEAQLNACVRQHLHGAGHASMS
jgi:CheY-like chemotaxis protein